LRWFKKNEYKLENKSKSSDKSSDRFIVIRKSRKKKSSNVYQMRYLASSFTKLIFNNISFTKTLISKAAEAQKISFESFKGT